ncbi:phosphoenolpyruvate--protein phosphotransferase [Pontiella sulfatireligans]|uniref:phosphoenolpyruvate--protein phosphotransferase n=1 Tax=Pontiella sulfatireligans TaxID=2750658 RepID=A0A6C2UD61_9BACT|nr:phosphoenolpyruvate--protein phosphotransferase [Pontiella sulfatireligans]VGO18128.1 Phosphoenolpyruvate-protein phosphotransferase [Pontiella sulfatireligans]
MGKANINMTFDIEELSSLFEKSNSLDDFLQAAVSVVAYHMRAAVCSIYSYDEASRMLTLRASQGLNRNAIGKLQLPLGQGLVGRTLKELCSVCVGCVSDSSDSLSIEGLGEERYKAFMAVPIRRQLTRVGVLVVQDVQPDYFDKTDEQVLETIAVQLAAVIENADLLMGLHRKKDTLEPARAKAASGLVKGRPASDGVACGKARLLVSGRAGRFRVPETMPATLTMEDFDRALAESERQLQKMQFDAGEALSDVAQLIFNAHLLILADEEFTGGIRRQIQQGTPPVDALVATVNQYVDIFSASSNPRLKEKEHDLKDLGHRLLENLVGGGRAHVDYSGQIILADTLLPSDVLKLATEKAEGFIIQGGITAHIAIICRSLHKPMVMVDPEVFGLIPENWELLIDGTQGTVFIKPSSEVLAKYEELRQAASMQETSPAVKAETRTADGTSIHLFANINLLSDLELANKFRVEGVGLYRSEFPFLIRDTFPMEEEQYQIYRRIVEAMDGREVTFRTLDIGGDKLVAHLGEVEEDNPFLGLRGIRFLLQNKDIFSEQICAMLRAGSGGNTRIMFPLISSVDEFVEARELVQNCMKVLDGRGEVYNHETKLGIMVELPSAVAQAEDFARVVDFMSIGTNDLIQYMLAVDRTNAMVSRLYLSYHPAILRAIELVAAAGRKHQTDVSICGDIARDPKMIPFLLGVGITKLSIAPRRMPDIQQAAEAVNMDEAVCTALQMLKFSRISEVEAFLEGRSIR